MQYFQLILDGIKNNSFLRDDVLQFLEFFATLSSTPPVSLSKEATYLAENDNLSGQSCHQCVLPASIQSLLRVVPTKAGQFEVCSHSPMS